MTMTLQQQAQIDRYITSGIHEDILFKIWPGDSVVARAINGETAVRSALISAVMNRAGKTTPHASLEHFVSGINARAKFAPMVRGLFSQNEQAIILDTLELSVVFLTPTTIDTVLRKTPWLNTAWKLANIYLTSLDAEPLSDSAPDIVGLSEETTCYVSTKYFSNSNPLEDYVVHEAAHIFHNCKRKVIGLPSTRHRECLLEIDYAKRETFAYACEAYNRILELGKTRTERDRFLSEIAEGLMPSDDRVEGDEYVDILRDAVAARNGWKHILERCSPSKQSKQPRSDRAA